ALATCRAGHDNNFAVQVLRHDLNPLLFASPNGCQRLFARPLGLRIIIGRDSSATAGIGRYPADWARDAGSSDLTYFPDPQRIAGCRGRAWASRSDGMPASATAASPRAAASCIPAAELRRPGLSHPAR